MREPERHFLGWDQPFIQTVAKWLLENHLQLVICSTQNTSLIVPSATMGRQLQSILVGSATNKGTAIVLPKIQTPDQFCASLLKQYCSVADPFLVRMLVARELQSMKPADLFSLFGSALPKDNEAIEWSDLAKMLCETWSTCAWAGVKPNPNTWDQESAQLLTEGARQKFELLAEIQNKVQNIFDDSNMSIEYFARVEFLSEYVTTNNLSRVILIGATELPPLISEILIKCLELPSIDVDVLIRAPKSHSAGFSQFGCVDIEYWSNVPIEIFDSNIHVAGSTSNQANVLLHQIDSLKTEMPIDEISIAATEEKAIPIIRKHLQDLGITCRFAGGQDASDSSLAIFIQSLATLLSDFSFKSFTSFVRHPDVIAKLGIMESQLDSLDRYGMQFLPNRISSESLHLPAINSPSSCECRQGNGLACSKKKCYFPAKELHRRVFEFLSPLGLLNSKCTATIQNAEKIRNLLMEMYGEVSLARNAPILKLYRAIFSIIDAIESSHEALYTRLPEFSISQLLRLIHSELINTNVPELPSKDAVEFIGWLEAIYSDSPYLFIVGMSAEELGSGANDIFFPNKVKHALSVDSVELRFARDAHAICAMQASRENNGVLHWIVSRKSVDGESRTPSPLLLKNSDIKKVASRSVDLLLPLDRESPALPLSFNIANGGRGMRIPSPDEIDFDPVTKVSATACREYIACPYRFWLKRVLKLRTVEESESELDAKIFGSLLHAVLEEFGKSTHAQSTSAEEIETFLFNELNRQQKKCFGALVPGSIQVQFELAKFRLSEFAKHQVQSVKDGWVIKCSEEWASIERKVGNSTIKISGVIDRIEINASGEIRVLDYKTGSRKANESHIRNGQWIDLQLPLYRELLPSIPALNDFDTSPSNIQMGYFNIGDRELNVGINYLAPNPEAWDCLEESIENCLTGILQGNFGDTPITPAPKFSEEFMWICQDGYVFGDGEVNLDE